MSPLARGKLTRPWGAAGTGIRETADKFGKTLYRQDEEANKAIVEAVAAVAAERDVPMAQVALALVAGRSAVTAPIVGATKERHIDDAVAAVQLEWT